MARAVAPVMNGIKLGLEFFVAQGMAGVAAVRDVVPDAVLFLDLKLHDIPNTVAGAVRAAAAARVDFLTIHTSGGRAMMTAAMQAARDESARLNVTPPKILGVTVLTTLDGADLADVGQGPVPADQVVRLANLARNAGLDGLVASSHEIVRLRETLGTAPILVVPGIRPAGAARGDQKRVMTPKEAFDLGADYLVIGRPITESPDPAAAAQAIVASL